MSLDASVEDCSQPAASDLPNGSLAAKNDDAMDISPGSSTHERDRKGSYSHRDYRERSHSGSPSRLYTKMEKRGGSRLGGRRDRDSRDSVTPPYKQRNWSSPVSNSRRSGGGSGSGRGGGGDRGRNESSRRRSKERRRRDKRSRSRSRHRSPKRGTSKKSRRRASSGSSSPDAYSMSSSLIGEIKKQHGDIGSSKGSKKKSRKRRKHSSSSSSSSGEVLDGPASSNGINMPTPLPPPPSFMPHYTPIPFNPPVPPLFAPPPDRFVQFPPPPHPPLPFVIPPPPLEPPLVAAVDSVCLSAIPPPPLPVEVPSSSRLPMPPTDSKRMTSRPVIISRRGVAARADWGDSDSWYKTTLADYEMLDQIGEGTYGQVYKAVNKKTGVQVALKRVRLENEKEGFPITAIREIKILRQLNHKNVVRLFDIVLDDISVEELKKTRANFYLVFEYVDHDLIGLLESKELIEFSKEQICSLFKQLLEGLAYCHNTGFLHRDIKCSNILVNNKGELKIADLGLARLWQKETKRLYTNRVITLWYRPPELLLGDECYGPAVDVWSAGCMLGELFTRKPIFNGNNELQQLDLISKQCGTPNPDNWPTLTELIGWKTYKPRKMYIRRIREEYEHIMPRDAVDLLDKMLTLNPDKRISAKEALLHPWIRSLDNAVVQPLLLPKHQDCHEMWSKKQKREARMGRRNESEAGGGAAGSSGSGHSRANSHPRGSMPTSSSTSNSIHPGPKTNGSVLGGIPPPPPPPPLMGIALGPPPLPPHLPK
ncbi:unnamed protein product [Caenorhabditis sp. 36 PRJEB53466]|nr:unnamed protein product [Caenorhabditis sp. 36 PRJEB53466]